VGRSRQTGCSCQPGSGAGQRCSADRSEVSVANDIRGSQPGSQRPPVPGDVRRRPAIFAAARADVRRHWATSGDVGKVPPKSRSRVRVALGAPPLRGAGPGVSAALPWDARAAHAGPPEAGTHYRNGSIGDPGPSRVRRLVPRSAPGMARSVSGDVPPPLKGYPKILSDRFAESIFGTHPLSGGACTPSGQRPRARREPARTGRGPSPANVQVDMGESARSLKRRTGS
jgi:hypothetical protein